jgi:hypothetical protein
VRGVVGHAGGWIDSFGVVCGRPELVRSP